ncbi:MAG: TMEM175 family protein [bacterium]
MQETAFSRSTGMTPRRLESLADGIFAFAMTILVLAINLPDGAKHINVASYLLDQYGNFYNFALSFVLLALFWMNHSQQFHHIKKTDSLILWLNIFILLFVVLTPFSTSLMNDYPDDMVAEIFFNLNMLVLSSMMAFNWWYSFKKNYIETEENQEHIAKVTRKGLVFPAIALLAVIASFVVPGWSSLAYLLIPIISFAVPAKRL